MKLIISNIVTATYEISKYLNKILTVLIKSKHSILNIEDLMWRAGKKKIPDAYNLISVDLKEYLPLLRYLLLEKP